MHNLIVRASAQADIEDALAWYAPRDPALVKRFLDQIEAIFERMGQSPGQFPIVVPPVQRAQLRGFPYAIFFVVAGDFVAVVAVLHHRRRPVDWPPADA